MTAASDTPRPLPRWLHGGAVLAVGVVLFPLVLGQIVTTIRAGMADPLWPTEPWYLLNNYKFDLGYLVEHSHRIAGFVTGGVLVVLTFGVWWTEPRREARWGAVVALVVLVAGFAELHRSVMAKDSDRGDQGSEVVVAPPPKAFEVPVVPAAVMGLAVVALAVVGGTGVSRGVPSSALRLFVTVVLLGVMSQGILGGLRVRLNALHGPELAAVHGVFAQVVFSMIVAFAVLSGYRPRSHLSPQACCGAGWLSVALVAVLVTQLIWGVQVRHLPNPLAQRMHFLTAFVVVFVVVWLLRVVFADPSVRRRVAPAAWVLGVFVGLQVVLGVEAWMGKFSEEARDGQPVESYLAETQQPPPHQVAIRTTHVLVGTGLLGAAVALAVRLRQRPAGAGNGADRGVAERSGGDAG